ncbi:MAG: hypothetical protein FWG85_08275 [Bacteroidetes bacterium]|nr:hypothetical protein [Bacteroidota bacterium]
MEDGGYEALPLPPVYSSIDDAIPSEYLRTIEGWMAIYRGTTPPNVVGWYIDDSRYIKESTIPGDKGLKGMNFLFAFFEQYKNNAISYDAVELNQYNTIMSYEEGTGSISGSGSNFTAYFITKSIQENAESEIAVIMSGTKTPAGIQNYTYAFLMLNKYDPLNTLVPIGTIRVLHNSNFLAKNTSPSDWGMAKAKKSLAKNATWNNGKGKEAFANQEFNSIANELNSFVMGAKTPNNLNNSIIMLPQLIKGGQ